MVSTGFLDIFKKPKARISLSIPKHTFKLGEDFKSTITVSSKSEFDATEVRAELRCIEKQRRERWVQQRRRRTRVVYWDQATLHSANPKASGKLHLVPGFKKIFSFKVNIPAGGRESFDGLDANVTWSIKGVVAVEGRPDITSKTEEIQVIRSIEPSTIKENEVVTVPCEYCMTLVPQTKTFCPKCGAPRKIKED